MRIDAVPARAVDPAARDGRVFGVPVRMMPDAAG